jgi:hypothetical protein
VTENQDVQKGKVRFDLRKSLISATVTVESLVPPKTIHKAKSYPDAALWKISNKLEFTSLLAFKTFLLMHLSDIPERLRAAIVNTQMVMRYKQDRHGNIEQRKSRLVARGDQHDTLLDSWSAVTSTITVRLLLILASVYKLFVHHCDVTAAFLHSPINEEVYIRLPEGVSLNGFKYAKLNKSLYGLKTAPRDWYNCQDDFLKNKFPELTKSGESNLKE